MSHNPLYDQEQRGMDALEKYAPDRILDNRDDIRATAIDLITDVLHGLARYGYDAESAHAMVLRHFLAERGQS